VAKTPRSWRGARTPSGLKRARQSERRHRILEPRRSRAKTLVKKALTVALTKPEGVDPQAVLSEAISALDRAAKVGAIHPNAAARRKSRLVRKVNAALAGLPVTTAAKKAKGGSAAARATKARIAASRAAKAKGAQTAAEKARTALARSAREARTSDSAGSSPATSAAPSPAPSSSATVGGPRRQSRTASTAGKAAGAGGSPGRTGSKATGTGSKATGQPASRPPSTTASGRRRRGGAADGGETAGE
jgi:small subunit ribosomal protein S20